MSARLAARVPVNTGAIIAITQRRPSRTAIGVPGITIPAAHSAHSRSQTTSTRRGGKRSAIPPSRVPLSAYGTKPSAKVSAVSSGDPVSRNTSTDSAISATTVPWSDSTCAAKTARNSRTAKTAR